MVRVKTVAPPDPPVKAMGFQVLNQERASAPERPASAGQIERGTIERRHGYWPLPSVGLASASSSLRAKISAGICRR